MGEISVTLRQFQDATLQPGKERVISDKEGPLSLPPLTVAVRVLKLPPVGELPLAGQAF